MPKVPRAFEKPRQAGALRGKDLKLRSMRFIDFAHRPVQHSLGVRENPQTHQELQHHDFVFEQEEIFLLLVCRYLVHARELGLDEVREQHGDARSPSTPSAVAHQVVFAAHRIGELPGASNAIARVRRHHVVQERRAGAKQARDQDRPLDRGVTQLGALFEQLDEMKPVDQLPA